MPAPRQGRQLLAAVRAVVLATVALGLVYPLLMTGIAQVIAPSKADGSLVTSADGTVVGSSLLGQGFLDGSGDPLPEYFQSRPSAGDWDGAASGGSNLGPNSTELADTIAERRTEVAAFNGVPEAEVPADAVTASAPTSPRHTPRSRSSGSPPRGGCPPTRWPPWSTRRPRAGTWASSGRPRWTCWS